MLAPPPPTRVLLAEADDGPGFCVTVIPTPTGPGHDRCFPNYLDARAHVRRLRFRNGWQLVDRVDAATRKAAEDADRVRRNG